MATWRLGDLATWRLGDLATWRLGDLATWRLGDLATWRLGDLATWRLGDLATWRLGDLATWRLGDLATWRLGDLATWRLGDLATWRLGDLATWRLGDLATWRLGDLATWRLGRYIHLFWYKPTTLAMNFLLTFSNISEASCYTPIMSVSHTRQRSQGEKFAQFKTPAARTLLGWQFWQNPRRHPVPQSTRVPCEPPFSPNPLPRLASLK